MVMLSDNAALGYLFLVLVCGYGTLLFSWGLWVARKQGWHISAMYLYVLLMFMSLGYTEIYSTYSRYLTLTEPCLSHSFRLSNGWAFRSWPLNIVLLAIVSHMTYRALKEGWKGQ